MILFVDACVRAQSRTRELAAHLLHQLNGEVRTLSLYDVELPELDADTLAKRERACGAGDFSAPCFRYARQFAAADTIVIAAPYWDLSFPARLKQYIESVCVTGITFCYTETGLPRGLCQARQLFYVTTSGGPLVHAEFGYGYLKALAAELFQIKECACFYAENLDIVGSDVESLMKAARDEIDRRLEKP